VECESVMAKNQEVQVFWQKNKKCKSSTCENHSTNRRE